MGFPKLTVPTFYLTVPSTKKKTKFRPFLTKEEKILMLLKQSESSTEVAQAMVDIIDACTYNELEVNTLSIFDIEYIFLQIRAKSVGEEIKLEITCDNKKDGEDKCKNIIPLSVKIDDIKVKFNKEHSNSIELDDNIGITLRYPSLQDIELLSDNSENDVAIIKSLTANVFNDDEVFDVVDISSDDLDEFVGNMSMKHLELIREKFFYNMPTLTHTIKYKCENCGNSGEYVFSGIRDFFS